MAPCGSGAPGAGGRRLVRGVSTCRRRAQGFARTWLSAHFLGRAAPTRLAVGSRAASRPSRCPRESAAETITRVAASVLAEWGVTPRSSAPPRTAAGPGAGLLAASTSRRCTCRAWPHQPAAIRQAFRLPKLGALLGRCAQAGGVLPAVVRGHGDAPRSRGSRARRPRW